MPTPPKSPTEIVRAARELIAERGIDALTMRAVADRVGVQGPSLYKHFADRADLLRAVEQTAAEDLKEILLAASRARDDRVALRAMASAYRRFARESPSAYALIFALHAHDEATEAARRQALEPALKRLVNWLGDPATAFVRARILTAFLHGFVSMEATGAFRFGGSGDEAFRAGIELLLTRPEKETAQASSATGPSRPDTVRPR